MNVVALHRMRRHTFEKGVHGRAPEVSSVCSAASLSSDCLFFEFGRNARPEPVRGGDGFAASQRVDVMNLIGLLRCRIYAAKVSLGMVFVSLVVCLIFFLQHYMTALVAISPSKSCIARYRSDTFFCLHFPLVVV